MKKNLPGAVRLIAAVALVTVSGCQPGPPSGTEKASSEKAISEAGYLTTPEITGATRSANGAVLLLGRAEPQAVVRLVSPEGQAFAATAGADGSWRVDLPAADSLRMFALAADEAGRSVHAQGAVVVAPSPSPAALMVRAGSGALPVGPSSARPVIQAVDYDPGGFAAVAGLAPANATVRLSLDGAFAGEARADSQGRFEVLAANRALSLGRHTVLAATATANAETQVAIEGFAPLDAPYRAIREPGLWRVEWVPPGGGLQTTLVLDAPSGRAS
jgi:hypothetical protein